MALGQNGTLFVGSRSKGEVYAVVDKDGDHRADEVMTIARGLQMPVGVAYRNGSLYVSAVDRILRFDQIEQRLTNPPAPVVSRIAFRKRRVTGGNSLPSALTGNSMYRSERHVIFVSPIRTAMP